MKKLPDFDNHSISKIYKLLDDEDMDNDIQSDEDADKIDEKNIDELSDKISGDYKESEDNGEDKKDTDVKQKTNPEAQEGGGSGVAPDKLKAITNDTYEKEIQNLFDTGDNAREYNYFDLPTPM